MKITQICKGVLKAINSKDNGSKEKCCRHAAVFDDSIFFNQKLLR